MSFGPGPYLGSPEEADFARKGVDQILEKNLYNNYMLEGSKDTDLSIDCCAVYGPTPNSGEEWFGLIFEGKPRLSPDECFSKIKKLDPPYLEPELEEAQGALARVWEGPKGENLTLLIKAIAQLGQVPYMFILLGRVEETGEEEAVLYAPPIIPAGMALEMIQTLCQHATATNN